MKLHNIYTINIDIYLEEPKYYFRFHTLSGGSYNLPNRKKMSQCQYSKQNYIQIIIHLQSTVSLFSEMDTKIFRSTSIYFYPKAEDTEKLQSNTSSD